MKRNFWLCLLAYLLPTFPIGYFWHLAWFADRYEQLALYRHDVIIPLGFASMLIQALIFAWAYPRLFSVSREEWRASALRCFATLGLLSWSFTTLPVAAKFRMASVADFILLETGFTAFQFAIVAPLMALAYRKKVSANPSLPT
ncbi:MAG TPA: hypothetical protein VGF45_25000 [Polyangia bacterium]